jgi:hypothetical protein
VLYHRSIAVCEKPLQNVILSGAKLNAADEVREARLSISDHFRGNHPEIDKMFESLALCLAFRCSASLNMTTLFKVELAISVGQQS